MFIVFEGGEGAGKTTALQAVAAAYPHALVTREPGGTPEGLALRALLLADDAPVWDPGAELLLMVAARVQHVQRVIRPALAAGRLVLCDRYLGSSIAYQGAGRGIDEDFITELHRHAVGLLPDLTILLDIPPQAGLRRSARRLADDRLDEGRFEQLDTAFHERVRASFLAQARTVPSVVIDAAQGRQEVAAAVLLALRDAMPIAFAR